MKKLIYTPLVMLSVIIIASCTKETSVSPTANASKDTSAVKTTSPAPAPRKTAGFYLINESLETYTVVFSGDFSYTFSLPPEKDQIVMINEGEYDINASATDNAPRTIVLSGATSGNVATRNYPALFPSVTIKSTDKPRFRIH